MFYESKYRGNVLLSIFITYISFIMKVWPYVIHNTEHQKFYYEQPSCKIPYAKGQSIRNSKMNYESKYIGNTPMEGIVTFTKFPTCI